MAERKYIELGEAKRVMKANDWLNPAIPNVVNVILDRLPAADVVEVVHGEWIPSPDGINPIKCRRCGTVAPYRRELDFSHDIGLYPYKSNYCPHCGAKMDGGKHETD